MKEIIYKRHLSIFCPDFTFRKIFAEKMKEIGYKVYDKNILEHNYIWVNEPDPSLVYDDYKFEHEDRFNHGNGKIRFAVLHNHLTFENEKNNDDFKIHFLELPKDWYEVFYLATDVYRSEKIRNLFKTI